MSWGEPGPGRRITVYANAGHAFMVVDGRRYDTSALSGGGTRWTSADAQHRGLRRPPPAGPVDRRERVARRDARPGDSRDVGPGCRGHPGGPRAGGAAPHRHARGARTSRWTRSSARVSEEVARCSASTRARVMRFIGGERAVIVGVHRTGGVRGLPVNAELDFDRTDSALGRAQSTLLPARVARYDGARGELLGADEVARAAGVGRRAGAAPTARRGARSSPRRPRRSRCRPAASSGSSGSPAARPGAGQRRRAGGAGGVARRGWSRPATRRAGGSSARCTRARTSTSSRSR